MALEQHDNSNRASDLLFPTPSSVEAQPHEVTAHISCASQSEAADFRAPSVADTGNLGAAQGALVDETVEPERKAHMLSRLLFGKASYELIKHYVEFNANESAVQERLELSEQDVEFYVPALGQFNSTAPSVRLALNATALWHQRLALSDSSYGSAKAFSAVDDYYLAQVLYSAHNVSLAPATQEQLFELKSVAPDYALAYQVYGKWQAYSLGKDSALHAQPNLYMPSKSSKDGSFALGLGIILAQPLGELSDLLHPYASVHSAEDLLARYAKGANVHDSRSRSELGLPLNIRLISEQVSYVDDEGKLSTNFASVGEPLVPGTKRLLDQASICRTVIPEPLSGCLMANSCRLNAANPNSLECLLTSAQEVGACGPLGCAQDLPLRGHFNLPDRSYKEPACSSVYRPCFVHEYVDLEHYPVQCLWGSYQAFMLYAYLGPLLSAQDLVFKDVAIGNNIVPLMVLSPKGKLFVCQLCSETNKVLLDSNLKDRNLLAQIERLKSRAQALSDYLSERLAGEFNVEPLLILDDSSVFKGTAFLTSELKKLSDQKAEYLCKLQGLETADTLAKSLSAAEREFYQPYLFNQTMVGPLKKRAQQCIAALEYEYLAAQFSLYDSIITSSVHQCHFLYVDDRVTRDLRGSLDGMSLYSTYLNLEAPKGSLNLKTSVPEPCDDVAKDNSLGGRKARVQEQSKSAVRASSRMAFLKRLQGHVKDPDPKISAALDKAAAHASREAGKFKASQEALSESALLLATWGEDGSLIRASKDNEQIRLSAEHTRHYYVRPCESEDYSCLPVAGDAALDKELREPYLLMAPLEFDFSKARPYKTLTLEDDQAVNLATLGLNINGNEQRPVTDSQLSALRGALESLPSNCKPVAGLSLIVLPRKLYAQYALDYARDQVRLNYHKLLRSISERSQAELQSMSLAHEQAQYLLQRSQDFINYISPYELVSRAYKQAQALLLQEQHNGQIAKLCSEQLLALGKNKLNSWSLKESLARSLEQQEHFERTYSIDERLLKAASQEPELTYNQDKWEQRKDLVGIDILNYKYLYKSDNDFFPHMSYQELYEQEMSYLKPQASYQKSIISAKKHNAIETFKSAKSLAKRGRNKQGS